ncbi:PTS sugar transporter subunit IIA [Amphibacillus sp. Q70]|uniref:PTS sugar transporter subunit IIA n=1 Tax=Amphibacillus sp. Q70 TaxID=3453416 RepID=UPI003F87A696
MAEILNKECIILNMDSSDKGVVIEELVNKLSEMGSIKDRVAFLQDVYERENIEPTYVGYNIGMPHGRTENVIRPSICFGRLINPIRWSDQSNETVNTVILIAVPQNDKGEHLRIISQLARNLMHEDYRNKLLESNATEVYNSINSMITLDL